MFTIFLFLFLRIFLCFLFILIFHTLRMPGLDPVLLRAFVPGFRRTAYPATLHLHSQMPADLQTLEHVFTPLDLACQFWKTYTDSLFHFLVLVRGQFVPLLNKLLLSQAAFRSLKHGSAPVSGSGIQVFPLVVIINDICQGNNDEK